MDSQFNYIRQKLKEASLDALVVSSPYNITYLTGYRSRDSYLIITKSKNIYLTDSRYIEEANKFLKGFVIEKASDSFPRSIQDACGKLRLKSIGFEANHMSFGQYKKIKGLNKKIRLVPTSGIIECLRQIKTSDELRKIRKAIAITQTAFAFVKKIICVGLKEIELAAELERFIRKEGAFSSSFDIIVASGPNSSQPHHLTGQRKIKNNEPVLIDLGVDYEGYKSDLTRVFFLGKISPIVRNTYDIVLQAQQSAISQIRPDEHMSKIDGVARQYIAKKEYGGFFSHALGHGVGLEVHEAPRISQKENNKLKTGMVFTVEPGIYLAGKFGIRLEDMVLVTKKGCEVLSGSLNK